MMEVQLPLQLRLNDHATFDGFCVGDNEQVVSSLHDLLQRIGERYIYLWGESGVGKTHLLQACCHALETTSRVAVYVPLHDHEQLSPDMLEGMEHMTLVCLDNINAVMGQPLWEEALFHLYNRINEMGSSLLVAAEMVPLQLPCLIPDLRSRLSQGLVLHVQSLDDNRKLQTLQLRAKSRGLDLPDEVGHYLLRHYPRNMTILFGVLEKLDEASLVMQRRLTIPFVKNVLDT